MTQTTQTEAGEKYADNLYYLARAQKGDEAATAHLMEANAGLVRGVAARFRGRGAEFDDLVQIGSIGMLKAIRSFDLTRGTAFSTYAVPLIFGEIRRFLRDDGPIKVGRRQKQLGAALLGARQRLLAETGQEPPLGELSRAVGIGEAEAALALEAIAPVHSLSEPLGGESGEEDFSLEQLLADEDPIERRLDQIALGEALAALPPLWRQIVMLRYYREYSQQATADALGLTQVKISREEKKIFARLRAELADGG